MVAVKELAQRQRNALRIRKILLCWCHLQSSAKKLF